MTACVDASRRASPPTRLWPRTCWAPRHPGSTAADWPAATDTDVIRLDGGDGRRRGAGRLLAERAPRKHLPWVTAGLVGAILLSAGYCPAGGYHYSDRRGPAVATAPASGPCLRALVGPPGGVGGFARNGTGNGGTGGTATPGGGAAPGGGFGGEGGATIGTVKLVDGNNVYLTDSSGATVKVTLAPNASVTVTKKGKLADLTPGTGGRLVVGKTGRTGPSPRRR